MALPRKLEDATEFVLKKYGLDHLKEKQQEILQSIMNQKDCLAILPTGYGKSLPHQLYLPIKKAIAGSDAVKNRVVVCCPLISLMEDQVDRIRKFGVTAALRGKDQDTNVVIDSGQVEVIFASPESLADEWVDNIKDVTLIVVDECHTIPTWGGLGDEEEKAFRKYFRHIGTLRSKFPEASILALSATCTLKMKQQVVDNLNMNNATKIEMSPNKVNIKYVVKRTPTEIESAFFWLVEQLNKLKESVPRILIYCNSIQDVCKLYTYIKAETDTSFNFVIDMYHSETPAEKREAIVKQLGMKSNLKVVIATSALGLGIDVNECQCVILYGPPKRMVDLLQESGRCGRNGENSVCIIMYNSYQLNRIYQEVKDVIKSTSCRRSSILKNFTTEKITEGTHMCCDLCANKCKCGSCSIHYMEDFVANISMEDDQDDSESESNTTSYEYESDEFEPDTLE